MLSLNSCGIVLILLLINSVGVLSKKENRENVLQNTNKQEIRHDITSESETHLQLQEGISENSGLLCDDMKPQYAKNNDIEPQSTQSPFTIVIDPSRLIPGETAKVTITTKTGQGQKLKGFALQAVNLSALRDINNSTRTTLGGFLPAANTNLQTCHTSHDTLIYTGPEVDNNIQFGWRSRDNTEGSVAIRGTFVTTDNNYWINVFSNRITIESIDQHNAGDTRSESVELRDAVSETLEDVRGPTENMEEVLIHQGVRTVQKIRKDNADGTASANEPFGVRVVPNELDNEVSIADNDLPETVNHERYIYSEMNDNPQEFERPKTSEFIGTLMNLAGGGGGGGGGGLSSMVNLVKGASTVSKLFGGGSRRAAPPPVGNGGLLGSLLGGGRAPPPSPSGGGGLLGSLLGGGSPPAPNPSPAGGLLGSLLGGGGGGSGGGLGNLIGSLAPPPTGLPPSRGPVTITPTDEPSLADLLGVDPSTVIDTAPQAAPSRNNPLASLLGGGSSGGGGGLGSLLGGGGGGRSGGGGLGNLATLASLAGPLSGLLGGGSKSRNSPPPMPGFGPPGMPGGMGGLGNNMFGAGGGSNPFGFGGFSQTPSMNQIMGMMQQQQAQISALQQQISGGSMPNGMGGFGNAPLNFGQQANAQLLGIPGQSPAFRNPTPFGQFNQMPQNNFGMNRNNQFQQPNNFGNNQFRQPNQFNQNNQFRNQFRQQPNNQFRQQPSSQFGNQLGQQQNNNFGQNRFSQNNPNQGNTDSAILTELVKQNRLLMEQLQTMRGPNQASPNNVNGNQQNQWQSENRNNRPQNNIPGTNSNSIFSGQPQQNQNRFLNDGSNNQGNSGNFSPTSNVNSPPFGSSSQTIPFGNTGQSSNPPNIPFIGGSPGQSNNPTNPRQGNQNNQNNIFSRPDNGNNPFPIRNNNNAPPGNNNLFGQNNGGSNNIGNEPQNPFGRNAIDSFGSQPADPIGGINNQQSTLGPSDGNSNTGSSSPFSMFGPGSSGGGGSSLTNLFGGGGSGNTLSSQLGNMLGGSAGGSSNNPLAGLLGGSPSNSNGGTSDISNLMKNIDTSAIGSMLGQMGAGPESGPGGNVDLNSLLGGADINKMQNALAGNEGQDLMSSINGLLGGAGGAGLMDAMNGMLSGDANAMSNIENILAGSNPADLQSMAQQAESLLSSSGIDPGQLIAQVMG